MPEREPAWTITTQVETFDVGPTGTFVQGVKVGFRTTSGALGSVFVPSDQYTVERVRALVSARAAAMETVAGLTG
jgi:hypothetical protein